MTPQRLRCEYLTEPLGIDAPCPLLSWMLKDGGRQFAWQIQVSSNAEEVAESKACLWDSGRVKSVVAAVPYGGKSLTSRRRCHWRVRVWDEHGQPGDWSEPAWWEAFLSPSDWHAKWLGRPEHDAGIQADQEHPGFEHFFIRPQIPEFGLDWVEASYNSVRGEIRSAWRRQGENLELTVDVPPNSVATVEVPAAEHAYVTIFEGLAKAGGTAKGRPVFEVCSGRTTLRFPLSTLRSRSR